MRLPVRHLLLAAMVALAVLSTAGCGSGEDAPIQGEVKRMSDEQVKARQASRRSTQRSLD